MWDSKYRKDLIATRGKAVLGGGQEAIDKQHAKGKQTARERINLLFDKGSFTEISGAMQSFDMAATLPSRHVPGDGVVIGYGEIDGRAVFAAVEDFTVNGGTLGEVHAQKICYAMDMAYSMKAPFIMINDSGGARIQEGLRSLNGYSGMFRRNVRASGIIPQIAVIMGPCAGGACYAPALCDFIFMVRGTSQMFITGPAVVRDAIGENTTVEELGGADVHMKVSGVAHFGYDSEEKCLNDVRRLLSYLPQSNEFIPSICGPVAPSLSKSLEEIVPDNTKKPYDMYEVIDAVFDGGSFFEVQKEFARNIIIGLARIAGSVCGIVANQPIVKSGALDVDSSDKAARFIRFCDSFNIPIITLEDVPAFWPGTEQEHKGIIRHGAKLLYAYCEATVPRMTVVLRKAYGGAYITMNSKGEGADLIFAWPIAEMAVMGDEAAVDIIYRDRLKASADPKGDRVEFLKEYRQKLMAPQAAAINGLVDEVILPEETRSRLIEGLKMMAGKKRPRWCGRHGNMPV